MSSDEARFLREWNTAIKKIEKASDNTIRAAALDLFGNIIKRTPVGNPAAWKSDPPKGYVGGALRGNWQTTIGSPAGNTVNNKDKSGGISLTQAKATTNRFSFSNNQSLFFTNNLPYAYRVEFGRWSQQAPAGMVRVSITSFTASIDKAARQNRI